MERDPLSNASRHISSQPVCNSISDMCDFKRGIVCYAAFFHMFKTVMVLNFDRKVMNFLLRLRGTLRKIFSGQCTQDIHVSKQVLISVTLGNLAFNHAVSTSLFCSFFQTFIILMQGEPKYNMVTLLIGDLLADLLRNYM